MGRGGGLVVSVPAFYSDDPSSNPAGYLINFLYEKTKINEKEAGVGPSLKKKCTNSSKMSIKVRYEQTFLKKNFFVDTGI